MKKHPIGALLWLMTLSIVLGCSGGGGSGSGTNVGYGTITMDITDAKPFIEGEDQPDELWLIIEEVLIHQTGSGWIFLNLPQNPFKINLLAFYDGMTTQLVPPALIPEGKITQIRIVISRAYMVFPGSIVDIDLDVPSGKLRTDKKCEWWMDGGGAVRITIHFDLSRSIVQTGADDFKLKPVFHLFDDNLISAATICAYVDNESFGASPEDKLLATLVYGPGPDPDDEIPYTKVLLTKDPDQTTTYFCIYWLVPLPPEGSDYYILRISQGSDSDPFYEKKLIASDVGPGYVVDLNGDDDPIVTPPPST